jgi:Nucleosome-binding factor SPN, POB3 subunit
VLGQKNRISAIHPYSVWDNAEQNGSGWDYDYMGFYKPLPNVPGGNLRVNESGIGWRTASQTLKGYKYDATETAKLSLPAGIEGGAFYSGKSNDYIYVLWAKTTHDLSETASASFTFPTSIRANRLQITSWNGTGSEINGRATTLSGSPVFIKCI